MTSPRVSNVLGIGVAVATIAAGLGAATIPNNKAAARPAGGVIQGNALTIAAAQGISTLDPHKITFVWDTVLYPLLWSGLVKYTENGGPELQPDLARSWKSSRDLKTWTFELRPDLKFGDGGALTADDVVRSIARAKNPKTGFYRRAADLAAIVKTQAVGPTTVRFTLKRPLATFPWNLLEVRIIDARTVATINKTPNATGPYAVEEFVPDDHVTLVPNVNYWGRPARVPEIRVVRTQDNQAAVASLRAGDVHAVWNVPWHNIKELKSNRRLRLVLGKSPATDVVLDVDNQSPPFNNVKARQALAYAIDRKTIVGAAYAGAGLIPWTNQPIPANTSLFDSSLHRYSHDLDKAKKLFAEAGIARGSRLTFWTPAGAYDEWKVVGQILQQDLAKIGIRLEIKTAEINTWAGRFAPNGKRYPGLIVPNFYLGPPPYILYSFKTGGAENNYSNPKYDALLDKADGTIAAAKRARLFDQAQQIFSSEVPTVMFVQTSAPIVVRSNASRVWIDPKGFPRFDDARRSP